MKLAIEAGCNAVAPTVGILGAVARRYGDRIPFIANINHNEFLTYPNKYQQILFGNFANVEDAWEMGRWRSGRPSTSGARTPTARSSRPSSTPTSWL